MNRKMFKNKASIVSVIVAIALVLGASMAYFTDYATTSTNGTAGTVAIDLASNINFLNDEGLDILNPGDMRDAGFDVTNMGNKSIDVRETIALTAFDRDGQPMDFTGDAATQSEFDLYLRDDVSFVEGYGYQPNADAQPLQVKSIDGNVITYVTPEYSLNGNSDEYDEVETVEGVDSFVKENDYVLVFKGEAGNAWQASSIVMDVIVEAKQHENTASGWGIVAQEQVSHGSITKDVVMAETVITDGTANSVFIPVTSVDKDGNDLNATSKVITGATADKLYDALEEKDLANREDVDALIEVESDDFEDMADTTFDVSNIAKEGDTVVILHYNEETSEWEYITTDTVDSNLTVGGDFSDYSPVAIIVIPKEEAGDQTEYEMKEVTMKTLAPNGDLMPSSIEMWTDDHSWEWFGGTEDTNGVVTKELPMNVPINYFVYDKLANFDYSPEGVLTITEETGDVEFKFTGLSKYDITIVDTNGVVFEEAAEMSMTATTNVGEVTLEQQKNCKEFNLYSEDIAGNDTVTITDMSSFTLTAPITIEADKPYYTAVVEPWEMSTVTFNFVNDATDEPMSWFCLEIDGKEVELESGDSLTFLKDSTHSLYACEDCFEYYSIDTRVFTADGDTTLTIRVTEPVPVEMVERKIIVKDQDGNRIDKAFYEIGYDGGDAMGLTDENGEAIVELPLNQFLDIVIYESDAYGDPDDYIMFGSINELTEDSPYEITFPDDMNHVDWF
mgnify:CR=1 FL=1